MLAAGVDMLQIREKDLPAGELYRLTMQVLDLPNPHGTLVFVNSRVDVALAAGAHGVHLPANALAPAEVRRIGPAGFKVGVSCHTVEEARRAAEEGADFAVFGPVFEPLSKAGLAPPAGLEGLRQACGGSGIPVLALGGITAERALECVGRGAAGVAAISLFLAGRVPVGETIQRLKPRI
jgi:thiamine-phosphate pyrophosphorylase